MPYLLSSSTTEVLCKTYMLNIVEVAITILTEKGSYDHSIKCQILISFEFFLNILTFLVVLEERAIAAKFTVNWSYLQLKLQLILNFCCLNKSFTPEIGFFLFFFFFIFLGDFPDVNILQNKKKKWESCLFGANLK